MQDFTFISKLCDPNDQQATSKPLRKLLEKDCKYVSISHKGDRLVGIGSSRPCGIDIESITTKHASFADFVMTAIEQKFIDDPVIAWSIKESCFKVFNDGYEPSDFTISEFDEGSYRVRSKKHQYLVNVMLVQGFVTTIAFVASDSTGYSSINGS